MVYHDYWLKSDEYCIASDDFRMMASDYWIMSDDNLMESDDFEWCLKTDDWNYLNGF